VHDVAILGAGIAGLTAAMRLREGGLDVEIVEARDRLGGRAWTHRGFDLGATWVWEVESFIQSLLTELGITTTPCSLDGLDTYDDGTVQRGRFPRSFNVESRIDGGMQALVAALAARAGPVHLGIPVTSIMRVDGGLEVGTTERTVHARHVLAALPPALVAPWVPNEAPWLSKVPVWMGEIAKCVGRFDRPVWREQGFNGRAFSRIGPMSEVHDLSTSEVPALFGFVPAADAHDLEARVADQFERLFGARPVELLVQRWFDEPYTTNRPPDSLQWRGHERLRRPLLDGRLHLISCETALVSPGHLDGAVERAEAVAEQLLGSLVPAR
jgi:monoamine oxidase